MKSDEEAHGEIGALVMLPQGRTTGVGSGPSGLATPQGPAQVQVTRCWQGLRSAGSPQAALAPCLPWMAPSATLAGDAVRVWSQGWEVWLPRGLHIALGLALEAVEAGAPFGPEAGLLCTVPPVPGLHGAGARLTSHEHALSPWPAQASPGERALNEG